MNTYEGEFTPVQRMALNVYFDGWTFKHVGSQGEFDMEYFYADKGDIHFGARSIAALSLKLIQAGHEKDK